ncbi:MAG: radical SAM protein [Bryobacteraceae bacterium]|jgi:anaerobic magnesium-protoporphyrin IX monomethyl ester cyclase
MSGAARVLLVGFQDQDNLGLGYLASSLKAAGHEVRIETFAADFVPLLRLARQWNPHIVGFSLIFQFMAPEFAQTMRGLRMGGVTAHFTIGGHYASFAPEALLQFIPDLDSVVRFEGERTLVELAGAIVAGQPWQNFPGIAWRDGEVVHKTPPRQDAVDLNALPWPERTDTGYHRASSLPTASVLGSRGCPYQCSFCSIITFYEGNNTRGRRRRNPVLVVDEIEHLFRTRGARLILFQDDDFLAGGRDAREWALTIARELIARDLHRQIRFKLSCRSDEVREELFIPLIEAGLSHVYMGVEAGDADSLKTLNKHITADVHLRAGRILRALDVSFDFGFMLLEPWSTVSTVRNNLHFLREFCAGGYVAAGFCRTLPYVGTPMEQRMRAEGRLVGPALEADYKFLDPRLDTLWDFSLAAFAGRNYGKDAVWDRLRGLLFEARLDYPDRPHDPDFLAGARTLADASNSLMLDVAEEALDRIESMEAPNAGDPSLVRLARLSREENERIRGMLLALWSAHPRLVAEELFR